MDATTILILDDEALVREGLRALLEKESFVREIHEAEDEASFREKILCYKIDLILLDVRLRKGSGLELLELIKEIPDKPKVIAVTGLDGFEVIINLLKAGVQGIASKLDGYEEIAKAINEVLKGGNYFPEKILKIIQRNAYEWDQTPPVVLNFTEKELLKGIASGLTTKEIASNLKMPESTVETYRIRLIKKLNVSNTASLLAYAYRNGIL